LWNACKSLPNFIPPQQHLVESIEVDGHARKYYLYNGIEKTQSNSKKLIFVLHGGGGKAEGMIYLTRLSDYAKIQNLVLVYPQGLGDRWNDGRDVPNSFPDQNRNDDSKFLKALARELQERFQITRDETHIVGLSNGGFMSMRLACESNPWFQSYFAVAATISESTFKNCNKAPAPISVSIVMGEKDAIVPFLGGDIFLPSGNAEPIKAGRSVGALAAFQFWLKKQNCLASEKIEVEDKKQRKKGRIFLHRGLHCENQSIVRLYQITEGQHIWPGGFYYKSEYQYGYLSDDLDTTIILLEFIQSSNEFRKREGV